MLLKWRCFFKEKRNEVEVKRSCDEGVPSCVGSVLWLNE